MKYLCFLSILIGFFNLSDASTWTLNRTVLEERLPAGVTIEDLVRVLHKENIEIRFESQADLTLWKGKRVSISLASTPFNPYHLWIAIEGRQTLDECTTDELIELYEAIWKSRKALSETIGADGFMISLTEEMRSGKCSSCAGIEIIPSGFGGSQGIMDALEKACLDEYVLYNRCFVRNVSQTSKIIAAIREKLQILQHAVQTEEPQNHWTQKLLHHKEALHQSLKSVYDSLIQMGALVKGEMPPFPVTDDNIHEIHIDLDKCAFCNPKVIEKQIVCNWKEVQVLMSHKPLSPYGNFLILPKRHQCAWDLTKEEAIASFEVIIALKKMFLETVGSKHWICYIQDGPSVGQTVPHTHIHFFLLPGLLKSAISRLQHIHNQRSILTYEEMRTCCEQVKSLILTHLGKEDQCDSRHHF